MTRMYVLVVVHGLMPEDYDSSHIEALERAVGDTINKFPVFEKLDITDIRFCFSFPQDPSITSGDVPVAVDITLGDSFSTQIYRLLDESIAREVRKTITWRTVNEVVVFVKSAEKRSTTA